MICITIFLVLALERYINGDCLRQWGWCSKLRRMTMSMCKASNIAVQIAVAVLPAILIIGILQLILVNYNNKLLYMLFAGVILWCCLGPRNLWLKLKNLLTDSSSAEGSVVHNKIKELFPGVMPDIVLSVDDREPTDYSYQVLLPVVFSELFSSIFGVIFWFAILGPVGAVLYRLVIVFSTQDEITTSWSKILSVLEWAPIRVIGFLYALAGNFVSTADVYKKHILCGIDNNSALLIDTALASMSYDKQKLAEETIDSDNSIIRNALRLFERVVIMLLVAVGILGFIII